MASIIMEGRDSLQENPPNYLDAFLDSYEAQGRASLDLSSIPSEHPQRDEVINPIMEVARPSDASIISSFLPVRPEIVKRVIRSGEITFLLLKDTLDRALGVLPYTLDFPNHRGTQGRVFLKEDYQDRVDLNKALLGSYLYFFNRHKKDLWAWSRTCNVNRLDARVRSSNLEGVDTQLSCRSCGFLPIGLYPNKFIRERRAESILLHAGYFEKALHERRTHRTPTLIPPVAKSFVHSTDAFGLGCVEFVSGHGFTDYGLVDRLEQGVRKRARENKISLEFKSESTDAFLECEMDPIQPSLIIRDYYVDCPEEMIAFTGALNRLAKEHQVRYVEAFASAYEPRIQACFLKLGLTPTGYLPSWIIDVDGNALEDRILFTRHDGAISSPSNWTPDARKFLHALDLT